MTSHDHDDLDPWGVPYAQMCGVRNLWDEGDYRCAFLLGHGPVRDAEAGSVWEHGNRAEGAWWNMKPAEPVPSTDVLVEEVFGALVKAAGDSIANERRQLTLREEAELAVRTVRERFADWLEDGSNTVVRDAPNAWELSKKLVEELRRGRG